MLNVWIVVEALWEFATFLKWFWIVYHYFYLWKNYRVEHSHYKIARFCKSILFALFIDYEPYAIISGIFWEASDPQCCRAWRTVVLDLIIEIWWQLCWCLNSFKSFLTETTFCRSIFFEDLNGNYCNVHTIANLLMKALCPGVLKKTLPCTKSTSFIL